MIKHDITKFLALALFLLAAFGMVATGALAEDEKPADEPTEEATEDATEEDVEEEEVKLPWILDVAEAKKLAAEQNKSLFINFTGSDWCGWCKRLDKEVFSHAEFIDAATKDFVFLFLDFPRAPDLQAKVVDPELNKELQKLYGVRGFPTLLLTLPDGTPYAKASYQEGGPENYVEYLAKFKPAKEAIEKLVADEKHEDTAALAAAFPFIVENGFLDFEAFAWTREAAEKADPDGKLGLKPIIEKLQKEERAQEEFKEFAKILPQSRSEEPDLDKIIPAMLKLEHQDANPQILNVVFGVSNALIQMGRPAEAKQVLEKFAKHPIFGEHERARAIRDQLLNAADKAIEEAAEKAKEEAEEGEHEEGEDKPGQDEDDKEHGDEGKEHK